VINVISAKIAKEGRFNTLIHWDEEWARKYVVDNPLLLSSSFSLSFNGVTPMWPF
jgi:hypothetical protein